ncbi:MAG: YdeI/OmpD-associated family protein [Burkholderiales bacterium]|nr:YdeI/OmpD-associated family protein [Burkholderiales bacterium]
MSAAPADGPASADEEGQAGRRVHREILGLREGDPEGAALAHPRGGPRDRGRARATFEGFPYSKKNEYVTWIDAAKREETRLRRLDTTVEQLAEGKSLMWKYEEKTK